MIDTLKLRLDDATFRANCDLDEKQPTFNRRVESASPSPFLYRAGDVAVRAIGAFHNSERFNLDVSPRPFDASIVDTTVHFSAAAVAAGGSNYHLPDADAFHGVLSDLMEWLDSIGVVATVTAAVPTRCDLTKNIAASEAYRDYQPVYAAMTPGRLSPHDYGTGYLWKNTAHQIAAYSKIDEMALKAKKKRHTFDASSYPANVQRFEWRLFGRKIRDALGVNTAGDLLDGYGALGKQYRDAMKRALFSHSPSDCKRIFTVADARQTIRQFIDSGTPYPFEKFWCAIPFAFLSESDLDAIFTAIKEESPNRNTPSRIKKKIDGYRMDALNAYGVGSYKTAAGLYQEIEEKIMDMAA